MPPKKSPPGKKAAFIKERQTTSDLTDKSETPTFKRKLDDVTSPTSDDLAEFKALFETYKKQQETKHNALLQKFSDLQQEHKHSQSSIEFLSKEYDEIKNEFNKLVREKKEDAAYIQALEERVSNLDKNSRSSGLEIRNVPVQNTETKNDLAEFVFKIGKAINEPIQMSDIRDVFRTNSKVASNKPIIVDFSSTIKKEKVLKSIKSFNKGGREIKLNSSHLRIGGPTKPVYVSESLSLKAKRLFSLARDFAKLNGFTYCWVSHSQVYLRKKEGAPCVRISTEADFQRILQER